MEAMDQLTGTIFICSFWFGMLWLTTHFFKGGRW